MDISSIADNLEYSNGIWFSKDGGAISYPESGNDECFQLEDNSFWFAHRNNCLMKLIRQLSPDKALFDIGGGNGFVSLALEQVGIKTILLEPGIQGIENGKKRGLQHLICSRLEDAAFHKNSLPAVGLFDVIEHIENDYEFIAKLSGLIQHQGIVYATVPAYNFLWSNADVLAGHHRRHTLRSLRKLFEVNGFEMIYQTYFFSFLPLPIFLFRSIPDRLGRQEREAGKSFKEEHKKSPKMVTAILSWELRQINRLKKIPFGGSCLIAARKIV